MTQMIIEADPNADLELWVKRCDRAILEKMYFLIFEQAKLAMEKVNLLTQMLDMERGLPDRNREGIYTLKMVDGKKFAVYQCGLFTIRRLLEDPVRYEKEIQEFLEELIE